MIGDDLREPGFGRKIDLEKYRSVGVHPTDRSGSTKTTRDELGNDITHHWSDDSRQDVTVRPNNIKVGLKVTKE